MAMVLSGDSVTINSPVSDGSWGVWDGSLTIAAGAAFDPGATFNVVDKGKLIITGGTLDATSVIELARGGIATISGGSVGSHLTAALRSTVKLSGGTIAPGIMWTVEEEAVLTIQGSGLTIHGNGVDSTVTGTLSDGSPLTLVVEIEPHQGAKVVLQNS